MGWTDPTTHIWAVSEVVSAANMNTFIEADLAFLYGDTAWTTPTYTNSWVDYGAPQLTVAFRRIGTRVALRGTMKSGTLNTAAFTLPSGYRPTASGLFSMNSNGAMGQLSVASDGTVNPTIGSNASFSLDGATFDTI